MLERIYILQAITINKLTLNITNYREIYSMVKSNLKVLPKADNANAEKPAESIVKADFSVNSAKAI